MAEMSRSIRVWRRVLVWNLFIICLMKVMRYVSKGEIFPLLETSLMAVENRVSLSPRVQDTRAL